MDAKDSPECGRLKKIYYEACGEFGCFFLDQLIDVIEGNSSTGSYLDLRGNQRIFRKKKLRDRDFLALSVELQSDTFVTGMSLAYNKVSESVCEYLGKALSTNKTLKELDLSMCDIKYEGCVSICQGLQENTCLSKLVLFGNNFGGRGAASIAEALQVNKTLQSLDIANTDQTSQSLIPISTVLVSNTTVEYLDVSRSVPYSDEDTISANFSELLMKTKTLVTLKLSKCDLTDSATSSLAFYLRNNTSLKHLDLSCNKISVDGARSFAEILKINSTLEELCLCANRIGDAGLISISEVLACRNKSLKKLWVTNNSITALGLSSLAIALQTNKTVTNIYIWGNEFGTTACDAFEILCSGEKPRLKPENIDFKVYEVDGINFLAETGHYGFSH